MKDEMLEVVARGGGWVSLSEVGARGHDATTVAKMAGEILRLRTLPVIATCGECRWCHPSEVCMHPKAHAEMEIDGCACTPPAWCPMRGWHRRNPSGSMTTPSAWVPTA